MEYYAEPDPPFDLARDRCNGDCAECKRRELVPCNRFEWWNRESAIEDVRKYFEANPPIRIVSGGTNGFDEEQWNHEFKRGE